MSARDPWPSLAASVRLTRVAAFRANWWTATALCIYAFEADREADGLSLVRGAKSPTERDGA